MSGLLPGLSSVKSLWVMMGSSPSTAHGPSNEQEHMAPERQGGWGHQQRRLSVFSLPLLTNVHSWLLHFVVLISLPTDLSRFLLFREKVTVLWDSITGHSRSFTGRECSSGSDCAYNAGGLGSIPSQWTRFHIPQLRLCRFQLRVCMWQFKISHAK